VIAVGFTLTIQVCLYQHYVSYTALKKATTKKQKYQLTSNAYIYLVILTNRNKLAKFDLFDGSGYFWQISI